MKRSHREQEQATDSLKYSKSKQSSAVGFNLSSKSIDTKSSTSSPSKPSILKKERMEDLEDFIDPKEQERQELERIEKRRRLLQEHEENRLRKQREEESRLKSTATATASSFSSSPKKSPVKAKSVVPPPIENASIPITRKPSVLESESDDDDMFADTTPPPQQTLTSNQILAAAPVIRQANNPALTDNWDDAEGYYRLVLGEILLDRYHVYANLGKGVFSSVVKAKDVQNGNQDVAIKIIRNNEVMYKAGLKEMNLLEKICEMDSANESKSSTIRLLSHFEHKSHLCLVFECLHVNLRQVLKKFGKNEGLNIKAVKSYTAQLMMALDLLQKCRIIHADIKPDNVLVGESHGLLKLADFGSAFPLEEGEVTPYLVSRFYRAPEIILGLPYDYAIDVWSVACTVFELYTGKMMFAGRNNNHMLALMMEVKGKFPNWMLRKATLVHLHFTQDLQFLKQDFDKISGKPMIRTLTIKGPVRSIRDELGLAGVQVGKGDALLEEFSDFLEKCTALVPEKRISVQEALRHPFLQRKA